MVSAFVSRVRCPLDGGPERIKTLLVQTVDQWRDWLEERQRQSPRYGSSSTRNTPESLQSITSDPALDPVRSDPRFARLVERVEREMGIR